MYNLYHKVYVANFERIEVEELRAFAPAVDNSGEGAAGLAQSDLISFSVYSSVGCPDDHFGRVEHVASISDLLALSRDELYASDSKIALVVSDEEFELLRAERDSSAKQLLGLAEGDGGRLYRNCATVGLPLELAFQLVDLGADPRQFDGKACKIIKNLIMYSINSKLGKLKFALMHDMEYFAALAAALNIKQSLTFPDSMFKHKLLGRAARGHLAASDFSSDARFRRFCLEISSMRLDQDTGLMFRDYETVNYTLIKTRLDVIASSGAALTLKDSLFMAKAYFVSKGDRYDLKALTDTTNAMLAHPQWWKNEGEYNAGTI